MSCSWVDGAAQKGRLNKFIPTWNIHYSMNIYLKHKKFSDQQQKSLTIVLYCEQNVCQWFIPIAELDLLKVDGVAGRLWNFDPFWVLFDVSIGSSWPCTWNQLGVLFSNNVKTNWDNIKEFWLIKLGMQNWKCCGKWSVLGD